MFDLVSVIVKVTNISLLETIVDAIGQTLRFTKALAFDITSSIRITFYHHFSEVPQNNKTCNTTCSQIHKYNSERFLKKKYTPL